jgi:isopenicillin N synthase-like dioxygenase
MMQQTIPVVDLQALLHGDPSQQQAFISTLGNALETLGFFAVVNHGVDRALIQQAYQQAEAFFQRSDEVKLKSEDPALNGQRGFTRFGKEHAKNHSVPDLKEFWHVGRESHLANLDPIPDFRSVMNELYRQLDLCASHLLEACALYLGEERAFLSDMTIAADSILRIIHYPPIPENADPTSLRSAPHEDINLITLLCEATDSGLELLHRDGTWLAIPNIPGQIIVDSGDMLQQLTNGLLKSTTHRVVNHGDRDRRFSMPFFVHPVAQTDLAPLRSCIARTGGEVKFPEMSAGEYLQQRLGEIGLK